MNMRYLSLKEYGYLLAGSKFYGTGGGGSPQLAAKIYEELIRNKRKIRLAQFTDLDNNGLIITAFAVGGLNQKKLPQKLLLDGLKEYQQYLGTLITGIIPVEVGPLSVALACKIAAQLQLPVVNSDIVGGRSTPEVFLETITLFDIPRTPLMVINSKGDRIIYTKSSGYQMEETVLRSFGSISQETAYILGYPLQINLAKKCLVPNTLGQAIKTGKMIKNNQLLPNIAKLKGKKIYQGTIFSIIDGNQGAFTVRTIIFKGPQGNGKLFVKNENLIFWVKENPVVTCPDLIVLLDEKNQPLYNLELKKNMEVTVVGLPASYLWHSPKGLKLFNPQTFGFSFETKLVQTFHGKMKK